VNKAACDDQALFFNVFIKAFKKGLCFSCLLIQKLLCHGSPTMTWGLLDLLGLVCRT